MSFKSPTAATAQNPKYYDGPAETQGDVRLHQRYFTYPSDAGWVAGKCFNAMFTIERPAREVWPHLKDLNRWQNPYGHYYSGVVGDLEGKTFFISDKPNDPGPPKAAIWSYEVLRVIPEHAIVVTQPIPKDGSTGGIRPGFHVFTLNEHDGKTVVTVLMEHASRNKDMTEEEALVPWQKMAPESQRKWRDSFIPTLKKLVYESA
jgi:uncharacterized protein YndB with AHSA1/START domain